MAMTFIASLAVMSCKQDDNRPEGETASVYIKIEKAGDRSRATGADMSTREVEFTDGYLIFTTGNEIGRIITITDAASGDDQVSVSTLEAGATIQEVPAATTHVYLYGNLGGSLAGMGTALTVGGSMATVNALTWVLADIQNGTNDVDIVPVYGDNSVAPDPAEQGRLKATLNVGPIASRLQIGTIKCTNTDVTKLELAGIYINNYYHSMKADHSFEDGYLVDHGIDVSKYPSGGYTSPYNTMSDVFAPAKDLAAGDATAGTDRYWAYNFFPAHMPHIVLHFTALETTGGVTATSKYATVSKYSTTGDGDPTKMVANAQAGYVYTLDIDITDYETQVTDRPESNSTVIGHVTITVIDWEGEVIYPEW